VREIAVKADRRTEGAEQVEAEEQHEVDQWNATLSRPIAESTPRRDDDSDERHDLADPARRR
jgi:hypothetical protein